MSGTKQADPRKGAPAEGKGPDNEGTGVKVPAKNKPSGRSADVGRALRSVYDDTLREDIPSDLKDLLGRLEGYYDQRITQRLILQPRVELNFAAQDVPANGIGSGLSDAELGLRLRYEIKREFAPYIGVSWERKFGDSARFARTAGDRVETTSLVIGIRAWF